jgi:hypothetical protein
VLVGLEVVRFAVIGAGVERAGELHALALVLPDGSRRTVAIEMTVERVPPLLPDARTILGPTRRATSTSRGSITANAASASPLRGARRCDATRPLAAARVLTRECRR